MTRDRSPLAQAGALLALAALLGTFAQVALPTRIPWREDWSHFVQAKALHDELEAVYNPHVDFARVYALAHAHALQLLG